MSRPGQQQGQQIAIVVGSADQFGALVVSKGKKFVKKHPVISVSWVVGLLVSTLASGYTPAPEAVLNYEVRPWCMQVPVAMRPVEADGLS